MQYREHEDDEIIVPRILDLYGDDYTFDWCQRAATTDVVADTGAKDDSAGDILTFANEVYDEANATKVGDDNGWCIRTVPAKAWECVATVTLADGQLTVEGPFLDGKDSVWAVTGGTGKYMATRGEMQLHPRNAEGSEFDFKFNLTE